MKDAPYIPYYVHMSEVVAVLPEERWFIVTLHPNWIFILPRSEMWALSVGDYVRVTLDNKTRALMRIDLRLGLDMQGNRTLFDHEHNLPTWLESNKEEIQACRDRLLSLLIESLPDQWTGRWCENKICGCMGGANCSGGLSGYAFTKDDWFNYMTKNHPERLVVAVSDKPLWEGIYIDPTRSFIKPDDSGEASDK